MAKGAVVFDMDGVIADTEPIHIRSWEVLFRRWGLTAPEGYFARFVGVCDIESVRTINADLGLNLATEATVADRLDAFAELVGRERPGPKPGFAEAFQFLREHGVPIGVATSSKRRTAGVVLDSVAGRLSGGGNGSACFDVVVTSEDVRAVKPNPECYALACARLARDPADCVAVEDSPWGIRAAVGAGMKCIGLTSPFFDDAALKEANEIVSSLERLVSTGLFTELYTP